MLKYETNALNGVSRTSVLVGTVHTSRSLGWSFFFDKSTRNQRCSIMHYAYMVYSAYTYVGLPFLFFMFFFDVVFRASGFARVPSLKNVKGT